MSATVGGGGIGVGTGGQEEDKKPMDQSARINLKVKGQVLYLFFFFWELNFFNLGVHCFGLIFLGFCHYSMLWCYFVVKNGVVTMLSMFRVCLSKIKKPLYTLGVM